MKRIGIVGGLGPEATLYYYRTLMDLCYADQALEGNTPEVVIYSLNLEECRKIMEEGRWPEMVDILLGAFSSLFQAGADFGLIAANTPHMVFDEINDKSPIPLLSIVEETCKAVVNKGLRKVGLLGTLTTMGSRFYADVFDKRHVTLESPKKEEQIFIYDKIVHELGVGIVLEETRKQFLEIAGGMIKDQHIEGLILGCTEIPLLLGKQKFDIPFFDTSKIHAKAALDFSLTEP